MAAPLLSILRNNAWCVQCGRSTLFPKTVQPLRLGETDYYFCSRSCQRKHDLLHRVFCVRQYQMHADGQLDEYEAPEVESDRCAVCEEKNPPLASEEEEVRWVACNACGEWAHQSCVEAVLESTDHSKFLCVACMTAKSVITEMEEEALIKSSKKAHFPHAPVTIFAHAPEPAPMEPAAHNFGADAPAASPVGPAAAAPAASPIGPAAAAPAASPAAAPAAAAPAAAERPALLHRYMLPFWLDEADHTGVSVPLEEQDMALQLRRTKEIISLRGLVTVRKSKIDGAGLGLFAGKVKRTMRLREHKKPVNLYAFCKDEVICCYYGSLVTMAESSALNAQANSKHDRLIKTDLLLCDEPASGAPVAPEYKLRIEGDLACAATYANDACPGDETKSLEQRNAELRVHPLWKPNTVQRVNDFRRRFGYVPASLYCLIALRHIKYGEEILLTYGSSYWSDGDEAHVLSAASEAAAVAPGEWGRKKTGAWKPSPVDALLPVEASLPSAYLHVEEASESGSGSEPEKSSESDAGNDDFLEGTGYDKKHTREYFAAMGARMFKGMKKDAKKDDEGDDDEEEEVVVDKDEIKRKDEVLAVTLTAHVQDLDGDRDALRRFKVSILRDLPKRPNYKHGDYYASDDIVWPFVAAHFGKLEGGHAAVLSKFGLVSPLIYTSRMSPKGNRNIFNRQLNMFAKDFVFFVVCRDMHWVVAVLCFPPLMFPAGAALAAPEPAAGPAADAAVAAGAAAAPAASPADAGVAPAGAAAAPAASPAAVVHIDDSPPGAGAAAAMDVEAPEMSAASPHYVPPAAAAPAGAPAAARPAPFVLFMDSYSGEKLVEDLSVELTTLCFDEWKRTRKVLATLGVAVESVPEVLPTLHIPFLSVPVPQQKGPLVNCGLHAAMNAVCMLQDCARFTTHMMLGAAPAVAAELTYMGQLLAGEVTKARVQECMNFVDFRHARRYLDEAADWQGGEVAVRSIMRGKILEERALLGPPAHVSKKVEAGELEVVGVKLAESAKKKRKKKVHVEEEEEEEEEEQEEHGGKGKEEEAPVMTSGRALRPLRKPMFEDDDYMDF